MLNRVAGIWTDSSATALPLAPQLSLIRFFDCPRTFQPGSHSGSTCFLTDSFCKDTSTKWETPGNWKSFKSVSALKVQFRNYNVAQ